MALLKLEYLLLTLILAFNCLVNNPDITIRSDPAISDLRFSAALKEQSFVQNSNSIKTMGAFFTMEVVSETSPSRLLLPCVKNVKAPIVINYLLYMRIWISSIGFVPVTRLKMLLIL